MAGGAIYWEGGEVELAKLSICGNTVLSESHCALKLRYAELVFSIEFAIDVCCCFTIFSC
jgi:hypothetical protein